MKRTVLISVCFVSLLMIAIPYIDLLRHKEYAKGAVITVMLLLAMGGLSRLLKGK